jgi:hypothetical protein
MGIGVMGKKGFFSFPIDGWMGGGVRWGGRERRSDDGNELFEIRWFVET